MVIGVGREVLKTLTPTLSRSTGRGGKAENKNDYRKTEKKLRNCIPAKFLGFSLKPSFPLTRW
jgi:hypothetical protein